MPSPIRKNSPRNIHETRASTLFEQKRSPPRVILPKAELQIALQDERMLHTGFTEDVEAYLRLRLAELLIQQGE